MRVELEHLDGRGLSVDLTPAQSHVEQKVRISEATGLAGVFEQVGDLTRIEPLVAERLVLELLTLLFGSVLLREQGQAVFADVRAILERDARHTAFDLESGTVRAASLGVDVGTVHVRGETHMREMRLWVRDGEGRLEASHLTIGHFRLHLGKVSASAPGLNAERVVLAWGADGFRLEAAIVQAAKVEVLVGGLRLHAEGLVIHALGVHRSDVSFSSAELASGELDFTFGVAPSTRDEQAPALSTEPEPAAEPSRKLLDYALLDGLSGELNVDAAVDMSVPVIGHRRATHRLRLGIEEGSINYRELESSLAGLEESMLDFSVRGSALVLELGIPLLPTRGLGKPLVLWDLAAEDLTLAERRRVRLAVLPHYRLAGQERRSEPPRDPDASSSFALRSLGLENLDLRLTLNALPEPLESVIRWLSFASLQAQGTVRHDAQGGDAPEGRIDIQLSGLDLALHGLSLGRAKLDLSRVQLAELSSMRIEFSGLSPTRLEGEFKRLVVGDTQLRA